MNSFFLNHAKFNKTLKMLHLLNRYKTLIINHM